MSPPPLLPLNADRPTWPQRCTILMKCESPGSDGRYFHEYECRHHKLPFNAFEAPAVCDRTLPWSARPTGSGGSRSSTTLDILLLLNTSSTQRAIVHRFDFRTGHDRYTPTFPLWRCGYTHGEESKHTGLTSTVWLRNTDLMSAWQASLDVDVRIEWLTIRVETLLGAWVLGSIGCCCGGR